LRFILARRACTGFVLSRARNHKDPGRIHPGASDDLRGFFFAGVFQA
jgi:hypothetical protein